MFGNLVTGGQRNYQIANSLRLRSSAAPYLTRTPGSAGNQQKYTLSWWHKLGTLPNNTIIFEAGTSGITRTNISFSTSGQLSFYDVFNTDRGLVQSNAVFRDPSAWYHFVVSVDTTNVTAANRVLLFCNGVQLATTIAIQIPQNTQTYINGVFTTRLNSLCYSVGNHQDGYLADVYLIDGQALTPSSFGQTDANGVWVPKAYSGTYGTNGFYLKFNDGSSTTNLCLDRSGNGNNWTPTNISVTAGATYDWMVDTPTNNYAVLNVINNPAAATFADANLKATNATADYRGALSTMAIPSSGKFYWEAQLTSTPGALSIANIGIAPLGVPLSGNQNGYSNSAAWYMNASTAWIPGGVSLGTSSTSDVFQIAFDAATNKVWLGRNNVWYWGNTSTNNTTGDPAGGNNQSFTLTTAEFYAWAFAYSNGFTVNFGQRPFTYTPPTGFKALCTANLPSVVVPNPKKHFDVLTHSGAGGTQNITGTLFTPDLAWVKSRSGAFSHTLFDTVRGTGAVLKSNATDAEVNPNPFGYVSAFNSNGITLTAGATNSAETHASGSTYVDWLWKANGAGVTNTSGSITSTVSANIAAGFSIVTFTGSNVPSSVGHGLGVVPAMYIVKQRGATGDFFVYHKNAAANPALGGLFMNLTNAFTTNIYWNNSAPSSTTFSLGSVIGGLNANGVTHVAYCFAEVPGFSRFGSYTGNGSTDGPFVYCGFRPRYLLVKASAGTNAATSHWIIEDTARDSYNLVSNKLGANTSVAENDVTLLGAVGTNGYDFLANGFKSRGTNTNTNESGTTYIFAAFAEYPFGGYNVPPANAR